jgi:hypothetical protein
LLGWNVRFIAKPRNSKNEYGPPARAAAKLSGAVTLAQTPSQAALAGSGTRTVCAGSTSSNLAPPMFGRRAFFDCRLLGKPLRRARDGRGDRHPKARKGGDPAHIGVVRGSRFPET